MSTATKRVPGTFHASAPTLRAQLTEATQLLRQFAEGSIAGDECPTCGRDNSEYGGACTSDDCLGVQARAFLKEAP